ncbi:MAG: T9SS type A sorting domain-containing protein [Candidatus Marinimicrobia bacterium]|nr:T9SS type A sorting domain-containing protein [Candidatus Neomarinimicrobiota bacterium]
MKYFIISLFFIATFISAQWSTDPAAPQSLGSGVQAQVAATSDGGVYVAWLSDGNYHVYLQRMNALGEPQLGDGGMVVSDQPNSSWIAVHHMNLAVDGNDNAIISTLDTRTGIWQVYAYKIAPDGSMPWGTDGLALSVLGSENISPRLTVLSDNSVAVAWCQDYLTVRIQMISESGALQWGDGGIHIEDSTGDLLNPLPLTVDGTNVLLQWNHQTGPFWAPDSKLYLQKYNSSGVELWDSPVVAVGPVVFPTGNYSQESVGDHAGGSFSAWTQMAGSNQSAVAQRISGTGETVWGNAVNFSTNSSHFRTNPRTAVAEGNSELMAAWTESNGSQSQRGVYAQRLDENGNRLWGSSGVAVVSLNGNYDYLDLSIAGLGNDMIAVYIEQSVNMTGDIYASRLNSNGEYVWSEQTVTLTTSGNSKSDMYTSEGPGCTFVVWTENGSVYAHSLLEDGTLGPPDSGDPPDPPDPPVTFEIISVPQMSIPLGMNSDGTKIVGTGSGGQALLWTEEDGIQNLGDGEAWGISENGKIIGEMVNGDGKTEAALWENDSWTFLGNVEGGSSCDNFLSSGLEISSDGSKAVGMGWINCSTEAFYWTASTGIVGLGQYGGNSEKAQAVSGNGNLIGGWNQNSSGTRRSCIWDTQGNITFIGSPAGSETGEVTAITNDGSIVVGFGSGTGGNHTEGYIWTEEDGMTGLGVPPNSAMFNRSQALDMSENNIVIGQYLYQGMTQYKACIYTEETGEFVNLQDYLVELGMTGLDDWDLMRGLTISDDGTVMAGMGNGPDGFGGWIIRVIEEAPEEIEVSVDHLAGWNIVGIPVDTEPINYLSVYPDAVDGTFYGFDGAYFPAENLVNGDGFWLRFDEEGTNMVSGLPLESIVILITEGWNLISGISFPVDVNAITDDDGLIVSGTIYGFDSGYISAEFIEPGYGYWLRSSGEGRITLSASAPMAKVRTFQTPEQSNTLKINGQTLFFGNEIPTENSLSYTLPPKPPAGAFDARFNGDMKYAVESGEIEVMNTSDNLTISYDIVIDAGEHMNWVLTSESGSKFILEGTDEITIPSAEKFVLNRESVIPITFALHQNYPNPFNPITFLSYDLPSQAQVTLTVYDLIGREVTQLVNTTQEVGYKSVQWNATDSFGKPVSAGVYLYQIQAGDFVQTRKMVLLK